MAGLTLVGVGPGDPNLLTVAAVRAIEAATVVAYPVAQQGAEGMAARIASPWLKNQQSHRPLLFPMVAAAEPRQMAWRYAADELSALVATGEQVVLLCEGDASLFASCSYVLLDLAQRYPNCPTAVIPGITAVAAAAAAAATSLGMAWPLALQQEGLLIKSTPNNVEEMEILLDQAKASGTVLALLKLGQRWIWLQPLLEVRGLLNTSLFAQRVGWPDQVLATADQVPAAEKPYFSLLLIRQSWPEVLP